MSTAMPSACFDRLRVCATRRKLKAEADWSAKNGGKKSTSAEIVVESLKGRSVFVPDSVKVVAQKEVKECLTEFAIQLELAPAPSARAEKTSSGRNGKAGKRK